MSASAASSSRDVSGKPVTSRTRGPSASRPGSRVRECPRTSTTESVAFGERRRIDEVDHLGAVVAPGRRVQQHALAGTDAESRARRTVVAVGEDVVARVPLDPDGSGQEGVRLAEDARGVGVLREQDVPAARLLDHGGHAARVEPGSMQREPLQRRAVPGLHHDLAAPARERAAQPVVDHEQPGGSRAHATTPGCRRPRGRRRRGPARTGRRRSSTASRRGARRASSRSIASGLQLALRP